MEMAIRNLYSQFELSNGVSIDTRTIKKNNLFFAISGPNFNANEFAEEALSRGASYAVIDDERFIKNEKTILVENSLEALQRLARLHRSKFKGPVLAITGSNGKTTTKELVANVLSKKYRVHATKGNYNNHIGVPLTLLHIGLETEIAIIEMGANHVGEIAGYCTVANPSHGLITNIGRAHTETFGGIEGVIRGKSELFDYLRKNDGVPFINMNDSVLSNMSKRFQKPVQYPSKTVNLLDTSPFIKFELDGQESTTKLIGKYNFDNISAAVSIGQFFEVKNDQILSAIREYDPENARSQIIRRGTVVIILDAYNANPDSMKASIESLSEQKGKKLAILGDMNELENSESAHREVLDHAFELGITNVLTVGDQIGKVDKSTNHFKTKEELENKLRNMNLDHTTVLLKASRSIKLETIINCIN